MSAQFSQPDAASPGEPATPSPRTSQPGKQNALETEFAVPVVSDAPLPKWLLILLLIGLFWAGAYLFSFSGGFAADVFDYQPKFGAAAGGGGAPVDPRVVGKALFSANCITCHQADGQGLPGQYPPLAGSEFVNGEASNRLIAIVLKGLQGSVQVKGQNFNNAMQPWEGQYSDQQLASILTYIRSEWGNNAPPITADMVKEMRAEVKGRTEQWTYADLMKMAPRDLTQSGAKPAAPGQPAAAAPASGGNPPAPAGASPPPASAPPAGSATPSPPHP
jgi:mono/diheme cytochrome c family protein